MIGHEEIGATVMLSLADVPLFSMLPDDATRRLERYVIRRDYEPGQMIALEGDPCREVYFVARGVVRQRQLSLEGREYVLNYLGEGSCLNLVPTLDGGPTIASADALAETTLYALSCDRFREVLSTSQEVTEAVAIYLAQETRRLSGMVRDLALYSVRARLARFLLQNAEHEPSQQRWTQAAIAASIGTVRDVVGRALRSLGDEGIIRRERGRLRIVNRALLEQAAHDE